MAKTQHTTSVSRRSVLAGAVAAPLLSAPAVAAAIERSADPVVHLFAEWQAVMAEYQPKSERVGELFDQIPSWAHGYPVPDHRDPLWEDFTFMRRSQPVSLEEVETYNRRLAFTAEQNPKIPMGAHPKDNDARIAWWHTENARHDAAVPAGYKELCEECDHLTDRMGELEWEISGTPAATLEGLAIKLALAHRQEVMDPNLKDGAYGSPHDLDNLYLDSRWTVSCGRDAVRLLPPVALPADA